MSTASDQRQAVADLATLAARDLTPIWTAGMAAAEVRDALTDLLPAVGAEYGAAAAALAADWYEEQRETASSRGSFAPVLAPEPDTDRWRALARWGVGPLFAAEPDATSAQALVSGGLQRTIADQHRLTIVGSAIADPAASGWRRVGVGGSCGFCRMLIDRGRVYTEAGVTFRSHDHCNCAAAPSFDSKVVKVSREPYRQSRRNRSDATKRADNARARAYIAEHY